MYIYYYIYPKCRLSYSINNSVHIICKSEIANRNVIFIIRRKYVVTILLIYIYLTETLY